MVCEELVAAGRKIITYHIYTLVNALDWWFKGLIVIFHSYHYSFLLLRTSHSIPPPKGRLSISLDAIVPSIKHRSMCSQAVYNAVVVLPAELWPMFASVEIRWVKRERKSC